MQVECWVEIYFLPKGVPPNYCTSRATLGTCSDTVENVRKKIFSETAEIIMLAQDLSSPIDLHEDDTNLMSLRFVLFCQISLKLANRFKSYGAGIGERLTNSEIIVSWGKKIIEAWIDYDILCVEITSSESIQRPAAF